MSDSAKAKSRLPEPAFRGGHHTVPCSTCGSDVDPLRASRVAIFSERFRYFCSPECHAGFAPNVPPVRALAPPPLKARAMAPHAASEQLATAQLATAQLAEPTRPIPLVAHSKLQRSLGLHAALILGLLGAVLENVDVAMLPHWLAPLIAASACAALLRTSAKHWALDGPRRTAFSLAAPVAATSISLFTTLQGAGSTAPDASIAGVICAVAAASVALAARQRRALEPRRAHVTNALCLEGPRVGEEIVLNGGQRSPVDAVIVAGRATVEPWLDSRWRVPRQEGDSILSGARVVDGALRVAVRWVGTDRAWARLTLDPGRRADRHLGLAKLAERLSTSGAAVASLGGALVAFSLHSHWALALSYAAAAGAALANVALPDLVSLRISQGLYRLLEQGISFRGPSALDRAARTSTVVFCAEGSLLSGELSVASIEPTGSMSTEELLSLIAGVYAGIASPIGVALARSVQAHQLRPDATRSPSYLPGMGVTAVASTGQPLVVGTRTLLLERRISVASAEARIAELEALGRSVLLVALDGRWVGLVALQDSLRPGARGAVQHLLDVGVEPVLLSGDARETCRALARIIGIEHVRPEVLPEARAAEIRRLSQTGATVAVIGRSSADDAALGAAQLSINMDPSGGPLERWDVDVASGDVRDAALVIHLARQLHTETRAALVTVVAPAAVALLLLVLGAPPWIAPLAGFTGSAVALARLKTPEPTAS